MTSPTVPPVRRFSDDAEVAGFVVVGYLAGAREASQTFADRLERQLATLGIEQPTADDWYPATPLQTAMFETADAVGAETLSRAGRQTVALVDLPPDVRGPRDVLFELDDVYDRAHRGDGSELDEYDVPHVADGEAVVDCVQMPYPASLVCGALSGAVDRVSSGETTVGVEQSEPEPGRLRFELSWD